MLQVMGWKRLIGRRNLKKEQMLLLSLTSHEILFKFIQVCVTRHVIKVPCPPDFESAADQCSGSIHDSWWLVQVRPEVEPIANIRHSETSIKPRRADM